MTTHVTVAVAAPNHLPVDVTVQELRAAGKSPIWVDCPQECAKLKVGEARVFLVHAGKRILIEEVPAA
jgi:hypothetical protein